MTANKFYPFKHITLSDKTFEDVLLLAASECGGNYYQLVFLTRTITTQRDSSLIDFVKSKLGDGDEVVDLGNDVLVNTNLADYVTAICHERCGLRRGKGFVYLTPPDFEKVHAWLTAKPTKTPDTKTKIAFCANEQDPDSPCLVYYDDGSTDKTQYCWTTSGERWCSLRLGGQCPTCEEKISLHIREDVLQDVTFIQWREWELQVTLQSKKHKININVCETFNIGDFLEDITNTLPSFQDFLKIPEKSAWTHKSQVLYILYEDATGSLNIISANFIISFGASSPKFTVEYLKRFDKFGFQRYTVKSESDSLYMLYLNSAWPLKIEEGPTLYVAESKLPLAKKIGALFLNEIVKK